MTRFDGCQIPCLPQMAVGRSPLEPQPVVRRIKRSLAVPWNYHVKRWLKTLYRMVTENTKHETAESIPTASTLQTGDLVRVRSWEEIQRSLDPFKELNGCAFLAEMQQYCNTRQRVLQVMERFLDERDYKVKKVRGVVLLENTMCKGTPVFGRCDRCCHLFWREEWLEKVEA